MQKSVDNILRQDFDATKHAFRVLREPLDMVRFPRRWKVVMSGLLLSEASTGLQIQCKRSAAKACTNLHLA